VRPEAAQASHSLPSNGQFGLGVAADDGGSGVAASGGGDTCCANTAGLVRRCRREPIGGRAGWVVVTEAHERPIEAFARRYPMAGGPMTPPRQRLALAPIAVRTRTIRTERNEARRGVEIAHTPDENSRPNASPPPR